MRIGFFADEYLPRLDGVITSMIHSAKGLEQLGHEVYFIVPAYPKTRSSIKVIRVPSTPVPLSDNVRAMLPSRSLGKKIASLKLDVIHSHTPFAAAQIARKTASELNLPHVSTFHTLLPVLLDYYPLRTRTYFPLAAAAVADILYSSDLRKYTVPPEDSKSAFKRQAWKWTGAFIDDVDYVISPSEHFAKKLMSLGADTPISVLANSIDLQAFPPRKYQSHSPIRLVAVGRLSPEKRQFELITAVSGLDAKKYQLTIVGDGPDKKRLESLVARQNLENVRLIGKLIPQNVVNLLRRSDIGVLASIGFDNQPMTILEYLASSLPVLYCDPALTEGLNQQNSLLSAPQPADLAATIRDIKPVILPSMSKQARLASYKFGLAEQAKLLTQIYSALT